MVNNPAMFCLIVLKFNLLVYNWTREVAELLKFTSGPIQDGGWPQISNR